MKRALTVDEKKLNSYSIKNYQDKIKDLELSFKENKLILDEGIDIAFKEQIDIYNKLLKDNKPNTYNHKLSKIKIEVIKYNYPKQKQQYSNLINEILDKIKFSKEQIKILKDQIHNGIEIKENKQVG